MTNYSFNLIDRECIWAVWREGNRRAPVSLRDALTQAHELREIHGDTPPETAALHRLLLTVLYRIFDPNEDWPTLWNAGYFDAARIDAYLRRESIYARFDLFGTDHPFFQLAQDAPGWTKYKLTSVSNLRPHYAAGNDAVLFDHRNKDAGLGIEVEDKEGGTLLSAAEAARALVTQQAFGFAGLNDPGAPNKADKSFSNAPCARGVTFLLEGDSLFETLLLNFFPLNLESHGLKPTRADKPAWELDDPFKDDPKRPYGYLDYATWLNRKVLLLPEGDPAAPVVRRMRYYVGMKRMNGNPFNPLMSLHPNPNAGKKKKGSDEEASTHLPLTFQTGKALWRDSAPLFGWLQERAQGYIAPRPFEWAHNELPDRTAGQVGGDRKFFFSAYGICSKSGQDKMYFFRAERFPLPPVYLQEIGLDAAKQLKLALQRAESAARILSVAGALGTFAKETLNTTDATQVRHFVEATGAERYFWSRLEANFMRLVEDLPTQTEQAVQTWDTTLRQLARQGFEEAVQVAGGMRALRAYGIAANWFEIQLRQVFEPPEIKEEKQKSARKKSAQTSEPTSSQLSMFNAQEESL